VFFLSVIKYNILEKEDITIGEILMLEQKLKFIQEFSKLLMLMILQESFTIMKEFNLGEVNHTLKILSFSLDQWLKWSKTHQIKQSLRNIMKWSLKEGDQIRDFSSI